MRKWNGILLAAWNATQYVLDGGGDAQSEAGASLSLQSLEDASGSYGGGAAVVDAAPFRNQRVRLSGRIEVWGVDGGAGLWLRADGPSGAIAFANTEQEPVRGDASNVLREVEINVPSAAQKLLFGPLMNGNGRVLVRQLRLERLPADTDANVPPAEIVKAAVDLMRHHALNADRVDWAAAQPLIARKVKASKGPADAYEIIDEVIRQLGDRHSALVPPVTVRKYAQGSQYSAAPKVSVSDGVGTVAVPGFSGLSSAAVQDFARALASDIAEAAPQVRAGWIVDLRDNPGGNMWPMLSGLSPLLGKEKVGSFRDSKGRDSRWRIQSPGVAMPDLSDARVAVLTGRRTASSGEAIVVAFRGRSNTRSFGQPTRGLSTGNQLYDLPGGARLALTTSHFVDRTGEAYGGEIRPDETVDEKDAIFRALEWLNEKTGN
jgi:hypothetical protein